MRRIKKKRKEKRPSKSVGPTIAASFESDKLVIRRFTQRLFQVNPQIQKATLEKETTLNMSGLMALNNRYYKKVYRIGYHHQVKSHLKYIEMSWLY